MQGFKHHIECWITEVAWSPNDDLVIGCRPNGYYGGTISGEAVAIDTNGAAGGTVYLGAVMEAPGARGWTNGGLAESARSTEIYRQETRRQGAYAINCWRVRRTDATVER